MQKLELRGQRDQQREHPNDQKHREDSARRPILGVVDVGDGPVAVQGNGHEVQDGRSADEDWKVRVVVALRAKHKANCLPSKQIQKSHNVTPNSHFCLSVVQAPKGVTNRPT